MLQALPFTTQATARAPLLKDTGNTPLSPFVFFSHLFAFCFYQGRGHVELASSEDFKFPLDGCWAGGNFFSEWLLIVLDHYNLCNFQRLYDYKEKRQTIGNTEPV